MRGLFRTRTVRRCIARDEGPEVLILDRVRAAVLSGRADERTAALLALMHAAGIHGGWIGRAVLRAIGSRDAMSAAVNGTL